MQFVIVVLPDHTYLLVLLLLPIFLFVFIPVYYDMIESFLVVNHYSEGRWLLFDFCDI